MVKKTTTNLLVKQMPADLHHKARIAAVTEGITLRELVIKALEKYLKRKG